ncbi:cytochrome c-type biogenesis protein [Rhizobium sp. L1K21]|uniref:cytochrome c-type biogenesis protein n=1 Tax=Rhizobium sp. L1K21 TaxID=2954933 RepID=UPI0020937184|nr:cytochrome c-type biogenesis protein [Rhizobium sp. L1K21]MCO6186671.1 cytochrome c-type biogenesis protein CcmH [Rhizobium sp. L1K21]
MIKRLILIVALLCSAFPAFAVNPDEMLADPALEARAREISTHLRCLVCQNQSIDDSNAELAKDLRVLVRDRIEKGETNEQVIDYIVSRYGEFVLLKPRFEMQTLLLWGMPAFLALVGLVGIVVFSIKRRKSPSGKPLSEAEKAALEQILKN